MDHRSGLQFAAIAILAGAACNSRDSLAPTAAANGGAAGAGAGAAGEGVGAAGMSGAGGDSGAVCVARHSQVFPESPGGPPVIPFIRGAGTCVLSLDEKTPEGWAVSLLSGDLTPPAVLKDGGLLSNLLVGDQIEISARQVCQAFSGCKSSIVVRNAQDHTLIAADFSHDPSYLAEFGELLDIGFELEPVCALASSDQCYEHEVQTQFRLLVEADHTVAIDERTHQPITIEGRPYTVWLGVAFSNAATGPSLDTCHDAAGFWWPGALTLTIGP